MPPFWLVSLVFWLKGILGERYDKIVESQPLVVQKGAMYVGYLRAFALIPLALEMSFFIYLLLIFFLLFLCHPV